MSPGSRSVRILVFALAVLLPTSGVVLGDEVWNAVHGPGDSTISTTSSLTVPYWIKATGNDCDAADGSPVTVTVNVPAGVDVTPASHTFSACGEDNSFGFTFSSTTPGTYDIPEPSISDAQGSYSGQEAKFKLHVSATALRASGTELACDALSVPFNAPTTCTATVSDTDVGTVVTPTGTVAFATDSTGGFDVATCSLAAVGPGVAACSAVYTPGAIDSGTHVLGATFGGDVAHTSSFAVTSLLVTQRATSTTLSCTPGSVALGEASTCTATVTDTSPGTPVTPSGTLGLGTSGTGAFDACLLSGSAGTATCSAGYTPSAGVGTHTLTADFLGSADHTASTGTFDLGVALRTTTTTIACDPASLALDESTSCTVTVQDTSPGTPTLPGPSADVTTSGTGTVGPCVLSGSGATATCTLAYTPTAAAGTHTLTATYAATGVQAGSSGMADLSVGLRGTSTGLACVPASVVVQQASTCTVTVTDTSSGTLQLPTGTITLGSSLPGGFTPCVLADSGTPGVATCTSTFTPGSGGAGTSTLSATFGGTALHAGSSAGFDVSVAQRATSTALSCTASVVVQQASTCTVTVTDTSPGSALTPTGTMSLGTDSAGSFGTCVLTEASTGIATCGADYTPAAGSEGTHALTATFTGDTDHLGSSAGAGVAVGKRATSTALTCASPVLINQASACTVTVTDTSPGTAITPAGAVSLGSDGSGAFGSCLLSGSAGVATCSTTYTPSAGAGTHTLTATTAATTDQLGSAGTFALGVQRRPTTTSIACAATTATIGVPLSCTVTVTDTGAGTAITPSGPVGLSTTGSGAFTTCTLAGSLGVATCTVTYTPASGSAGAATLGASFASTAVHLASASDTLTQGLITVLKRDTATSVSCTGPVLVGSASTCTATVTDSAGAGFPPTGTVTWSITSGGGALGATSCTLGLAGTCSVAYTPSSVGAKVVKGTYGGDGNHNGSNGSGAVTAQATTSLLYTGDQMVFVGNFTTFSATLSGASGCVSGKTVSFTLDANPLTGVAGSYSLGSGATDSSGNVKLPAVNTTGWVEGVYTVTVTFAGDAYCLGSSDTATYTAGSAGDSATGGGWYTPNGRSNFGFVVNKVPNSSAYKGQLLFINNGKWRLKADLNNYTKTKTNGSASGTGTLSFMDGSGAWVVSEKNVNVTISFADNTQGGGKKSSDTMGIHIVHVIVAGEPSSLPNGDPQPLKGGDITMH